MKRQGKLLYSAFVAARMLREGKRIGAAHKDPETSEWVINEVVGVPGFPDGRQIPSK